VVIIPAGDAAPRSRFIADTAAIGRDDAFPEGFVSEFYGVDSEVGRLRTVLVHRPGAELRRVTPNHRCGMLLPGLPWAERARAEHDAFADALRAAGVSVLYLTESMSRERRVGRRTEAKCKK